MNKKKGRDPDFAHVLFHSSLFWSLRRAKLNKQVSLDFLIFSMNKKYLPYQVDTINSKLKLVLTTTSKSCYGYFQSNLDIAHFITSQNSKYVCGKI